MNFTTELYVDGVLKTSWSSPPPTQVNFYRFVQDYNLGSLSAGTRTLRIKADSTNAVAESNENDNEYTKTITIVSPTIYSVSVSASPPAGGTVSGGGNYAGGSSVTVTASTNSGYTFSSWTENGSVVSTSASYTFTVNGNRTLVANFAAINYTITTSASPSNGGTTNGGGTFAAGTSQTVTATANSGYTFSNWTENGGVVSTSAIYTFTLNSNRTLVANFATVNYIQSRLASPSNSVRRLAVEHLRLEHRRQLQQQPIADTRSRTGRRVEALLAPRQVTSSLSTVIEPLSPTLRR